VEKQVLPNGLTLLYEKVPSVRSASIGVWLKLGSRHERPRNGGVCHFIEHLVFKGTATRSARDISLLSDRIGGNVDAFTSKEVTCFHAKVLDEHLPIAADLLGDMVRNSLFDAVELERERMVILEEIKMVRDSPDDRLSELFSETFWPAHPLGRPIGGTPESIRGMSRKTVMNWHRRAYVPQNLLIAVAGRITAKSRRAIEKAFAAIEPGRAIPTGRPPRWKPGVVRENRREMEQVQLLLGIPGLPVGHPDRFIFHMLNTVLGGTISSRLFHRIREERGLAYAVSSGLNSHVGAGVLVVHAGTAPGQTREVVMLILDELRDLATHEIAEEELAVARDHVKGNVLLGLESTASRMHRLAREEMTIGRHYRVEELVQEIERVTPADVHRLAQEKFAGVSAGLALIGRVGRIKIDASELRL